MQRVDLSLVRHEVHRTWVRGQPGGLGHATITIGRLITGCWYVGKDECGVALAWIAANERHAGDVVQRWIKQWGGAGMWRDQCEPQRAVDQ